MTSYDPAWPTRFIELRERAHTLLGGLATRIEHVGSTSVPGLAAKPIIDLDVVVACAEDLQSAIRALTMAGYVHEGDKGIPGREAMRWPPGEERHHLYVCQEGSKALRDHLIFRDFLRSHPHVAAEYGMLKQRLAELHGSDRRGYACGKQGFIDRVTEEADGG